MHDAATSVLVVGAGPVGLLAACELARRGVALRVIDKLAEPTDESRAIVIHARSLESGLARHLRDAVLHAATGLAPVRSMLADSVEEVALAYRDSPAVQDGGHRHRGRVHAGDHMPQLPDAALDRRLRHICAGTADHVVLTVAAAPSTPGPPPDTGGIPAVHVAVSTGGGELPGYDAVVADPARVVAGRYGLPRGGGRVAIRPDGYLGAVGGSEDGGIAAYGRRLAGG